MKRVITILFSFSILLILFFNIVSFISPSIANAQGTVNFSNNEIQQVSNRVGNITNIDQVAQKGVNIGNLIIEIAISVAVLFIIINTIRYFIIDAEADRKAAGMMVFYSIVGLFVILSIWGLVAILRNSFRTQDARPQNQINNIKFGNLPSTETGNTSGNSNGGGLYNGSDTFNNYCNNPSGSNNNCN
jgi:flagellar biosynthesis protein FlhB